MQNEIIFSIIGSLVAFFSVFSITPKLITYLESKKLVVKDYNRKGGAMVPRPGGPAIIIGILASEAIFFIFFQRMEIIALMLTTGLAFLVGFIDDRKIMGGWFKPLALAACSLPIIFLGAYDSTLAFPLFGEVKIPLLYLAIIVVMIPITGNTINSIDVMNGVASGFMTIASFSLTISLLVMQNFEIAIISLPLGLVSLAFYKYHRFPSKIFPGDSGALTWGAMYGSLAIIGQVEIVAAIALLPAVINSFLFLSSMKRIVEHREIKSKPVIHTDDFKLMASKDKDAPVTLVRLILSSGPLSEKEVGHVIFKLAIFSGTLAIISAFLMGIRP